MESLLVFKREKRFSVYNESITPGFKKATKISVQKGMWCNFTSRPLKRYTIYLEFTEKRVNSEIRSINNT